MTEYEKFLIKLKLNRGIETCVTCGKPLHEGRTLYGVTYCKEHAPADSSEASFDWNLPISDEHLERIIKACKEDKVMKAGDMVKKVNVAYANAKTANLRVNYRQSLKQIVLYLNPTKEDDKKILDYLEDKESKNACIKDILLKGIE